MSILKKSFFLILFTALTNHCFAKDPTIYESSINWEDKTAREKILENTPKWPSNAIKDIFETYRSSDLFAQSDSPHQYNIKFINTYWGPLANPFNKYPRPAKIFLFPDDKKENFVMGLLIHETNSGNYFVFDKHQTQPLQLDEWIKQNNQNAKKIYFNLCMAYGSFPNDLCSSKTYHAETKDAYPQIESIAHERNISAYRAPYENWQMKAYRNNLLKQSSELVPWDDKNARDELLKTVIAWNDYKTIDTNFKKIRDLRYFSDEQVRNFPRRITWLYPDDGCWTRGAAVLKDLFGPVNNVINSFPRPSKIFAFGNLCANTKNSPSGYVSWWYHTAPIIRDAATNQSYVLDPSINPNKPLPVETWIAEISSSTGACKQYPGSINNFSICNGYGAYPHDQCSDTSKEGLEHEIISVLQQSVYRQEERSRLEELERDADSLLGDNPPWEIGR